MVTLGSAMGLLHSFFRFCRRGMRDRGLAQVTGAKAKARSLSDADPTCEMVRFIGMTQLIGKARARQSCTDRLKLADRGHAFDKLQRASLLRRGVDPLREHELDLPLDLVNADNKAELPLSSPAPDLLGKRRQRSCAVEINLHADVAGLGGLVERSKLLHAHLDAFTVGLSLDLE